MCDKDKTSIGFGIGLLFGVIGAKKQALESVDLLRYKLEKQYKKIGNMLKSKKMRKAKELESESNFNFDHD